MVKKILLVTLSMLVLMFWSMAGECFADAAAELGQAEKYKEGEDYEQAEAIYKTIVRDYPGTDDAFKAQKGLTSLYIGWEKEAEAEAAYEQLVTEFGGHESMRSVVCDLAYEYRSLRKWAKSRQLFRYFLERWPDDERAMRAQRLVAKASIRLGDDLNADAAIEKLIELFGDKPGIRYEIREVTDDWTQSGRYEKAQPLYKYVVQRWPKSEHAAWDQMAVAATSAALRDGAAVTAALDKLRTQFGGDTAVAKVLGPFSGFCRHLLEIADEQPEAVEAVITMKLLEDFEDRDAVKVVDHIGDFYRDTREYDKAAEAFNYVADNWRGTDRAIEAQTNIVKMYISVADEPNTQAAFGRLMEKFSGDERVAWAVEQVAERYWDFGSVHKAYDKYKYILEHWPGSEQAIWAQMGMVQSQVRLADYESAENELGRLLSQFSEHKDLPAAVHEIVEEYRNTGAHETGRELFGYLLENRYEGEHTMLEFQVGVALSNIRLGEEAKTQAAIDKLIADYNDNPYLAKSLFQIAEEHFYANNYQQAIELWELISSDYPQSQFETKSEIPCLLGVCYVSTGNWRRGIEYYKDALKKYPDDKHSHNLPYRIGLLYRNAGEYDKALYWLKQQRELYPDRLHGQRALFEQGALYALDLKDYEKAAEAFQQYVSEYADDEHTWPAYYGLAKCYEKMGNKAQAVALLQEALTRFSGQTCAEEIEAELTRLQKGGEQ